jgi:hypothetical protein
VQDVPTGSSCAVQGLSFAGGGGTGEQVISIVPQFATFNPQPGAGPETRMK